MVSTIARNASHAPSQYTSVPAMIAGRSAFANSSAARATSPGSGASPRIDGASGTSPSPWANTTSSGKSRKTGPRCGVAASAVAATTSRPMAPTDVTVADRLVTGASTGTWSNSWSDPAPQRSWGARPPSTTNGEPLNHALVTALIPFVTPGPAVRTATPGRRVSFAVPSAANVAVLSCRTSTMRTSWSSAAS
jgi:hypothetical protein